MSLLYLIEMAKKDERQDRIRFKIDVYFDPNFISGGASHSFETYAEAYTEFEHIIKRGPWPASPQNVPIIAVKLLGMNGSLYREWERS